MGKITLVIYGEPTAQGRPRFTTRGGFPRAYDPAKSRDYKERLKTAAIEQMQGSPPLEGALTLSVRVYRSIPKSMSKKKAESAQWGKLRPITKPDVSNYIKGIEDTLNGVCWHDDSQIVAYKEPFGKYYSTEPRVEIEVDELEGTEDK